MADYTFKLYDVDGSSLIEDITTITFDKHGAYRLNRPTQWSFKINPAMVPDLRKGCRLRVYRDSTIVANNIVMYIEREGDKDIAWAQVNTLDPMCWWSKRLVRDETGDYTLPKFTAVIYDGVSDHTAQRFSTPSFRPISGAEILKRTIAMSQLNPDPGDLTNPAYPYIAFSEGTMWTDTTTGDFDDSSPPAPDLGVDDLVNWPMSIGELASTFVNTGTLDTWVSPLDGADPMCYLNAVTQRGSDVSGSVTFSYSEGGNVDHMKHTEDLDTMVNKLRYLLGPGIDAQHWKSDVGVGFATPSIEALVIASVEYYGVSQVVRIYDSGNETAIRNMYAELWNCEQLLRGNGQEMVIVTPTPESPRPFDDFNLGDIVGVSTDGKMGVTFAAQQRIYGFDVMPDNEGVERLGELIASADQE